MLFTMVCGIMRIEKFKQRGITVKNEKKAPLFRAGDLAAILLVLLLVGALLWALFSAERGSTAQILVEGEVVATLPLSKDTVYPITARGYHLTVCIEDGAVFVRDADCPDLVCEHTGRISSKGTSIVCAAAGVSVKIAGGGNGDADFVAG